MLGWMRGACCDGRGQWSKQAGGTVLDFQRFAGVQAAAARWSGGRVVDPKGIHHRYGARLLMDGMGAISPLAQLRYQGQPFAGVCPTVGTIVSGLAAGAGRGQHDPDVGDILVSVAGAQHNRQLIWEGFAGRDDELTVYVFYYDLLDERARRRLISAQQHSLLDLFEDYFSSCRRTSDLVRSSAILSRSTALFRRGIPSDERRRCHYWVCYRSATRTHNSHR